MAANNKPSKLQSGNAAWRFIASIGGFLLPGGEPGKWAFAGATAVTMLAVLVLIFLGRVSYAKTDFFLLPPSSGTPSVTPLPPASQADALGATFSPGPFMSGTSIGSPNAPITMVIYSDFFCQPCQQFALTTEKDLEKLYVETGKVRLVYKHFILHGEDSMLAAQAAESAAEQNKFWPYHDLLMKTLASSQLKGVNISELESLAEQLGLDMTTFDTSLESGKYREKVMRDDAEGRMLGVTATPTFFINRMIGRGNRPLDTFQQVIEDLLKESGN